MNSAERQAEKIERHYDNPPMQVLLPTLQNLRGPSSEIKTGKPVTYYNRPMIHKPTWRWYIPFYFFLGGLAGGVAIIGAMAQFFGGERHRATVRNARWIAVIFAAMCPLPLIWDLGRRARFHHMLRIFKVASPLNIGTWILSAFGAVSGLLAAQQAAEDNFILRRESRLGRFLRAIPSGPFAALHALLGVALGGYTGTLLAITVIPLWAAAGVLLGPLFLATAVASGAAALTISLIFSRSSSEEARKDVEAVETAASVVQLGVVAAREVLVPSAINKPLRQGFWGRMYQFGAVGGGMGTPLALRLLVRLSGRRVGPVISAIASTLALLGALVERFALTEAGKLSADDPLAYQELTRAPSGEARPTPKQQARRSANKEPYRQRVSVSDL